MPILLVAVVCLAIFLVMGVLAVSAVRKELRSKSGGESTPKN